MQCDGECTVCSEWSLYNNYKREEKMRKVLSVEHYDSRGNSRTLTVGEHPQVDKIEEHGAQGEGDKWFYDVYFKSGQMERLFNPVRVFFDKEELETGVF